MKTTIRAIIVLLIVALAYASTVNIHTRAGQLHANAGVHSWIISTAIAVIFAMSALALVISQGATARTFFAFCTVFGALLTSTLQTGMYLQLGADTSTALAFGAGVPVLEALLAVSEHFLSADHAPRKSGGASPWNLVNTALANRIAAQLQPPQNATSQLPTATAIADTPQPKAQEAATETPVIALPSTVLEAYNMQRNGMTLAEIATQLRKSERTISNYLRQAKAQTNGHSKAEVQP